MRVKFNKNNQWRLYYRSGTNLPSVTQLQSVIDNSNPLLLSSGNEDLNQEITHSLYNRFSRSNVAAGSNIQVSLNGTYIQNYIGNSIIIADSTIRLREGVLLNRGSQFTRPENIGEYYNLSSNISYGKSITKLKSNLNLSGGLSYNSIPGLVNRILNKANYYTISGGMGIVSNISAKVDFSINYSAYYNIVKNTLQQNSNYNYYNHTINLRFNINPWKGLVLSSDINNIVFQGLGAQFNRNFWLWNPYIGYKFMKNRSAELRLSAFDILNQNNSISRNITSNYVEDVRTVVLRRYFMFSFIYTLRNLPVQNPENNEERRPRFER